jgi:cytoskeleton protein RodZ
LPSRVESFASLEASAPAESMGRYLSRQRRLRGISLEELAQTTRIPLRSLERLEAGSFDRQVDGFVRGFVRTVAQGLGLDPDDTVARLLQEVRVPDASDAGPASPLRRVGLLVLAVGMLAGLVAAWSALSPAASPPPAEEGRPQLVYRRDPVRALAEAQGPVASAEVSPAGSRPPPP